MRRQNPFRQIYDTEAFKVARPRAFPFLVDVELTNYCNLGCIFCGQRLMKRPKGFIDEETLLKVFDECSEFKAPIRFIRWGEPFLHPNIIEFCALVKLRDIPLHITTNGLALDEGEMKALVEIGVDSLVFSFQGATKEQYEIMRDNDRYDELKANVLKMVDIRGNGEKPFVHISTTVTDESEGDILEFTQYWSGIADSCGVGKTNFSRFPDQRQGTIEKTYRPCKEVFQKLSVDWDGKVTCCCGDFDNFLTVGDLSESTLFHIWNNSRELEILRELLDRNMHPSLALCRNCYPTYKEF